MNGFLAIAIGPGYFSKAGKKTTHIGTFWSECDVAMKHRSEIINLEDLLMS